MENQNQTDRDEVVIQDVFNAVKFRKDAEIAFENYYKNPTDRNLIATMVTVTDTDFYDLSEAHQKRIAFAIGMLAELLDNNIDSESRKKATAFANCSFMRVLAYKYNRTKDENLKTRIVNLANCRNADEMMSYIKRNLSFYVDSFFNVKEFVEDLKAAEDNATKVLKDWMLKDFIRVISGKEDK